LVSKEYTSGHKYRIHFLRRKVWDEIEKFKENRNAKNFGYFLKVYVMLKLVFGAENSH